MFYPEGRLINTQENNYYLKNLNTLKEAMYSKKILEAKATLCDKNHNLSVDLNGLCGIIPREEGAIGIKEGLVRDIALISRVNRPVCFTISSIENDSFPKIILSRCDSQKLCIDNFISSLKCGDIIDARITHIESFGAFADIGCGVIALLPIDGISVSRISHPRERFSVDSDIKAVIKSIGNGRITLSHKELLGTWKENAEMFSVGETVTGIVRSIENYGVFVELTPNLAGLAESKEGISPGSEVSVYIKNIIPSRMKIKLIIIDSFGEAKEISSFKYFINKDHIDEFIYSPEECQRKVISVF